MADDFLLQVLERGMTPDCQMQLRYNKKKVIRE